MKRLILRRSKLIYSILYIFFVLNANAQISNNTSLMRKSYEIKSYSIKNGLENSELMCIVQDKKGYIWLGGAEGVTRYNGFNSITYTTNNGLPCNPTRTLYIDKKEKLWTGGFNGGPSYYVNNRFKAYAQSDTLLTNNLIIYNFTEDAKGKIYIATNKGFYFLENGHIKRAFSELNLGKIEGTTSILWHENSFYLGLEGKIIQIKGAKIITSEITRLLGGGYFFAFNSEKEKKVIYCNKDILILNNNKWEVLVSSNQDGKFSQPSLDKDGKLWFGKFKIYNYKNGHLDSLPNSEARLLKYQFCFFDKNENIWVNSSTDKVNIFRNLPISIKEIKTLNSRFTKPIKYNEGLLYLDDNGTLINLFPEKNQRIQLFPAKTMDRLHLVKISSISEEEYYLTDGFTTDNIYRNISKNKLKKINSPSGIFPLTVIKSHAGEIIVGTKNGVYKNVKDSLIPFAPLNKLKEAIYEILEDQNENLWLLATNKIFIYKNQRIIDLSETIKEIENINPVCINLFKNKIVVGTGGNGIYIFEMTKDKIKLYDQITDKNGLINNTISAFFIDDNGNCLIQNAFKGFNYVYKIIDKSKRKFISLDQYYFSSINTNAIELSYLNPKTGICQIYMDGRLIEFDSSITNNSKTKPSVNLIELELFKTKVEWDKKGYTILNDNIPENLKLDYNENYLTFYFEGIDFSSLKPTTYQYKLLGSDTGWINKNNYSFATYNNLLPGTYTFVLKSISNSGIESNEVQYTFTITPPWWNTWWFRTLYISLFGASIIIGIRVRLNRLRKQNELLNIKVNERTKELRESIQENKMLISTVTHDIRGPLADLQRLSELMRKNWDDITEEQKKEYINDISVSSALTSSFTSNFLTWIKSQRSNINYIEIFNLKELIQEIISFHLKCNNPNKNKIIFDNDEKLLINSNKNYLRIIIYNIIENSLKYTFNGIINVTTKVSEDIITIKCSDTGKGINENVVSTMNQMVESPFDEIKNEYNLGWKIIKDLALKINATTKVESSINGTVVTLKLENSKVDTHKIDPS